MGVDVAVMGVDVAVMGVDVAVMRVDVAVMRVDVAVMGVDVAVMGVDVAVRLLSGFVQTAQPSGPQDGRDHHSRCVARPIRIASHGHCGQWHHCFLHRLLFDCPI